MNHHLVGSEDVVRGARMMNEAAARMERAIGAFGEYVQRHAEALERHEVFLEDWLSRARTAEVLIPELASVGTPQDVGRFEQICKERGRHEEYVDGERVFCRQCGADIGPVKEV